jgi:hypothetical protein
MSGLTPGLGTGIAFMVGQREFMLGRESLIGSFAYGKMGSLAD